MTTTVQGSIGRRFQLSRVGQLTFDLIRRDFAANYGLALAILVVPGILKLLVVKSQMPTVGALVPGRFPAGFTPVFLLVSMIGLLASLLAYAALSWRAVERMQGRTPGAAATLEAGFRALPVLIAVAVLGYLALVVATLLLIFPALMLACAWLVVVPAAACEQAGVFRAFGRSAELTKGHRWPVFGLLVVLWIGSLVFALAVALVIRATFGLSGALLMIQPTGPVAYVALGLQMLIGALVTVVFSVMVGVVFQELRALKGGFDTRHLSDVFA